MMVVKKFENSFRIYPHLKGRFENIQLYAPTFYAEQLRNVDIYMDVESLVMKFQIPLYRVRPTYETKISGYRGKFANR